MRRARSSSGRPWYQISYISVRKTWSIFELKFGSAQIPLSVPIFEVDLICGRNPNIVFASFIRTKTKYQVYYSSWRSYWGISTRIQCLKAGKTCKSACEVIIWPWSVTCHQFVFVWCLCTSLPKYHVPGRISEIRIRIFGGISISYRTGMLFAESSILIFWLTIISSHFVSRNYLRCNNPN